MKTVTNFTCIQIITILLALGGLLASCAFPGPKQTAAPETRPPTEPGSRSTAPAPGEAAPNPAPASVSASTRVPERTSWQIQAILWGTKAHLSSQPVTDADGNLLLAYVDRYSSSINLGTFSQTDWKLTRIARSEKESQYLSLALDPDGGLHVSYYQPDSGTIFYGKRSENGWKIEKALKDVEISALALVIGPDGLPGLIFSDTKKEALRFAQKTGETWQTEEIATTTVRAARLTARYGPDQLLHLVYGDRERGLVYLTRAGAAAWQAQVIDPAVSTRFSALGFDPDGTPVVSYYDPQQALLKVASGGAGNWHSRVVDASGGAGRFSSLAVGPDHKIHISYADETRGLLKYASGRDDNWEIWIIDEQRQPQEFTFLRLDPAGNPQIVYYDENSRAVRDAFIDRSGAPDNRPRVTALHRSGQTFVTWQERVDLRGETYRVYRSSANIRGLPDLKNAQLLAELGEHSARFYASYHDEGDQVTWRPRYTENLIIADGQPPVPDQVGLLVWTVSAGDIRTGESGYYAVTVTPAGGEEALPAGYTAGPLAETSADPRPVEISATPGMNSDPNRHIYLQFMDLRHWNATFHAPNSTNDSYGFPPDTPGLASNLQYAYDYTVFAPSKDECGGTVPDRLPVYLFLHGYRGNRYGEVTQNPFPFCAYGIYPVDVTETWYFGFAQQHDFRREGAIEKGDVIENYTEQRILRMVYDLLKNPPGPAADEQRIYVFGHSMGGSGTLALAERYPNVFAAAYSAQPITHYSTAGVTDRDWAANVAMKWGSQELNLPVAMSAPGGWADPLQRYNGTSVWDWQNYLAGITRQAAADLVPLALDHGTKDSVITYATQGAPLYEALQTSRQAWGGLVNDADHEWSDFAGMPPAMGNVEDILPFWNFSIIRAETVPGISHLKPDPLSVEGKGQVYAHTLLWSSSWNPWDGPPLDLPGRWQMSFCAGKPGSSHCGGDSVITVDLTPRRTQKFQAIPGRQYTWKNILISSGAVAGFGTVTAGPDGLITVPGFVISPSGNRLLIEPASLP